MSAVGGILGPQGPPSFCPGHLRACPHAHIVSPSPWGSQTFLGLLWGSPRRASIVVWQMRGEDNFLLPPLSSPPSAQGQTPQDPLQAPNQVRKHGVPPPPVSRGGASGQTPRLLPQGGQEGWPLHDAGLGALAAGLIIVVHEFARDLPGDEGEAAGGRGIGTNCERWDRPC